MTVDGNEPIFVSYPQKIICESNAREHQMKTAVLLDTLVLVFFSFAVIEEVLAEPFETARWIGVAGRHFGWGDRGAHPAPVFRKAFVGERASGGRLAITGAGYYYAELNGRPVTDARLTPTPSNYDRAVHWTEYDVSPLLRDGTNVIEVTLGSGFYDYSLEDNFLMSQASWRDRPMFIVELRDASGRVRLATDATWDVCVEGPWRFDSIRRGTVYDARLEKLDDPKSWRKAEKKHGVGGAFRRADHPPVRVIERRPMRRLPTGIWDSGQNAAWRPTCRRTSRWRSRSASRLTRGGRRRGWRRRYGRAGTSSATAFSARSTCRGC